MVLVRQVCCRPSGASLRYGTLWSWSDRFVADQVGLLCDMGHYGPGQTGLLQTKWGFFAIWDTMVLVRQVCCRPSGASLRYGTLWSWSDRFVADQVGLLCGMGHYGPGQTGLL